MATWWTSWLEGVWRDIRHAIRGLRRSPGFAAIAILTLALGIGVNTAIFSVVNGLLLRALPVAAPEQLALVSTRESIEQGYPAGWNYQIWNQIRQRQDRFDGAVAWTVFPQSFDLAMGGERQSVDGLFVSSNFFSELGIPLLAGRGFTESEDILGSADGRVAVISYGFWQRHFGGAADVVGKSLQRCRSRSCAPLFLPLFPLPYFFAHAAASLNTPVNHGVTAVSDFTVPANRELPPAQRRVIVNLVTPGWFETYGMMVRAGRAINERDTAGAEAIVVANQAFAQKFFPNGNAVGSIIYNSLASTGKPPAPLTIVGVVANAVDQSLRANAVPTVYQPLSQFSVPLPLVDMSLSVRAASGSPAMLARGVSAALTSVDRNLSFTFHPLDEQVGAARQRERWLRGFPASSVAGSPACGNRLTWRHVVCRREATS